MVAFTILLWPNGNVDKRNIVVIWYGLHTLSRFLVDVSMANTLYCETMLSAYIYTGNTYTHGSYDTKSAKSYDV
jgi:hypothetical protein